MQHYHPTSGYIPATCAICERTFDVERMVGDRCLECEMAAEALELAEITDYEREEMAYAIAQGWSS